MGSAVRLFQASDAASWPRPPPVVAGAEVRVTSKLDPSLPMAEGIASGRLFAFTIVIACAPASPSLTRPVS
jgi:hypothetical protein